MFHKIYIKYSFLLDSTIVHATIKESKVSLRFIIIDVLSLSLSLRYIISHVYTNGWDQRKDHSLIGEPNGIALDDRDDKILLVMFKLNIQG